MTTRLQNWLLKNTGGLQYFVNERLAKRPGLIGRVFKHLEIGKREMSAHSLLRTMRIVNFMYVQSLHIFAVARPIGSRFLTSLGNGPLNYSALFCYFWCTGMVLARCIFGDIRHDATFNHQDGVQFWQIRYNMSFPANYLHNRISAHYIEINSIFFVEMLKRYMVAKKEIIDERERHSDEVKRTRYALNPNYIYEPFQNDAPVIAELKAAGEF